MGYLCSMSSIWDSAKKSPLALIHLAGDGNLSLPPGGPEPAAAASSWILVRYGDARGVDILVLLEP